MRQKTFILRITQFVFVLIFIFSLGLQWALLQAVAWTSMFISYSRNAPLTEAVVKTFDGEHPCPMCLKIRESRQQEERQQKSALSTKTLRMSDLILSNLQVLLTFVPTDSDDAASFVLGPHADFIESPPTPPPRGSFAVS